MLRTLSRLPQMAPLGHCRAWGWVGSLLTLEQQQWALAVEVVCGRHFDTFLVHDAADLARLKVSFLCTGPLSLPVERGKLCSPCLLNAGSCAPLACRTREVVLSLHGRL